MRSLPAMIALRVVAFALTLLAVKCFDGTLGCVFHIYHQEIPYCIQNSHHQFNSYYPEQLKKDIYMV